VLICFFKTASGWDIVDYKTHAIKETDLQAASDKFKTQLQIYALALRNTVISENDEIRGRLYFSNLGKEVVWTFSKSDLDALSFKLKSIDANTFFKSFKAPEKSVCENCFIFKTDPSCPTTSI